MLCDFDSVAYVYIYMDVDAIFFFCVCICGASRPQGGDGWRADSLAAKENALQKEPRVGERHRRDDAGARPVGEVRAD
jgi:hypothetical protein